MGDVIKIVTNRCHGGFGLSDQAIHDYANRKKITLWPESDPTWGFTTWWTVPPEKRPPPQDDFYKWSMEERAESNKLHEQAQLTPREIERDDPCLVKTVLALGEQSNGLSAKLDVTEIPMGVEWQIEEYDGLEWIAEKHRTW